MEFKGNLGKRITTEENYVVIKHKSFAWGSYEKQVPYCTIKAVEIAEPSGGTAGYIRLVENGDERVFNQKKGDASFDTNSVLFNGKKNLKLASDLKEVIEAKVSNKDSSSEYSESIFTKKKKGGKLKFVVFAIVAFVIVQCNISNSNKKKEALS